MVNWEKFQGPSFVWDDYVSGFPGGFYQTYGWGEVRRVAGWLPMRILARRGAKVVALANILVKQKFGVAVCWIPGGPLGDAELLNSEFRKALRFLLGTSFFYCRINILRSDNGNEASFLYDAGWRRPQTAMTSGLTMIYPLMGNEGERLGRASVNWRHNLKRSKRHDLVIEHWKNPDIDAIIALYREMESLKSIPIQLSSEELKAILEHCEKQVILYRCQDVDGRLLAIRAAGVCGLSAMDLLAVAGKDARKVYASYATLWALLDHCNMLGLYEYDLSGVDPAGNKGVFDFKLGTGASVTRCLGEWEMSSFFGLRYAFNWLVRRKAQ
ncbi:peptidoglycan bridge formation glycyltransferase FemA/FemB family protein [Candidatus Methylopumilus universalis]|uniref:Peptidoglycan bridge formation glycyltransferase FemA/FemB family protein n=1 Tax=Candidatus Methylopumilus universalis TaxID=2588536 RepID=A0ABX5VTQ9_9PROT|nr:peptidoglycan bridge formation glycyltransferase FemA/FemB family protein [Candidatus Methylopumilus universalis]QDC51233.1 peptidoglycan bridge formation glycyltransferase FemA/FemB family protein [Candidatus Methylopumilus universalis]QDC61371.1 peptidoglycan bridge formation glycyltransferase FemA/FemB family protein [Candidatus Methylopumilus universalis]